MNNHQLNHNIKTENFVDIPVRSLIFLLKKLNVFSLFQEHVKDYRAKRGTYSIASLLMIAMSMLLFRSGSKNHFYQKKQLGKLSAYKNIAILANLKEDRFPDVKTIDDAFLSLKFEDLEPILFKIFKHLCVSKLFSNHSSLKKDKPYCLSIDAYHVHTYHDTSQHPCKHCCYCLKKERKNSEGETTKIWYTHVVVIASLIFENGFQLPLCCHRIEKRKNWEGLSEDDLKQQCELTSLPIILKKIRTYLPKVNLMVLLDGLYANQTALGILKQFHCGFSIVLKKLISVQEDFKGLIQNSHEKTCSVASKRFLKTQSVQFANEIPYHNHQLNVLQFHEEAKKRITKRFAKVQHKQVHYQWLIDQKIQEATAFATAKTARSRWHGEDLANTLKNRGFNLKHDYSRHPSSQGIWLFLTLIAFSLTSTLLISDVGILSRKKATVSGFMKNMLQDLFYLSYEAIFSNNYPKQLRFSIWMNAG